MRMEFEFFEQRQAEVEVIRSCVRVLRYGVSICDLASTGDCLSADFSASYSELNTTHLQG